MGGKQNGKAQPVAGYRSKGEAIAALHDKGLAPHMIARQLGTTVGAVHVVMAQRRRRAQGLPLKYPKVKPVAAATRDTRGLWTPEKLDKARSLFGKTMLYIAEALQVPPAELLAYAVNGTLPFMGERQHLAAGIKSSAGEDEHLAEHEHGGVVVALPAPAPEPAAEAPAVPPRTEDAPRKDAFPPAPDPFDDVAERLERERADGAASLG